jgi:hypothetical protein
LRNLQASSGLRQRLGLAVAEINRERHDAVYCHLQPWHLLARAGGQHRGSCSRLLQSGAPD